MISGLTAGAVLPRAVSRAAEDRFMSLI
jgi:hypothetical protein